VRRKAGNNNKPVNSKRNIGPADSNLIFSRGEKTASFPLLGLTTSNGQPNLVKEEYTQAILAILNQAFGVDFTHYKKSTIGRRIARRMVLNQTDSLKDYVLFLQSHPRELKALFEALLINVTHFFRELATFDVLQEKIFPKLLNQHLNPIRIWVPGCSTGEDVYSIAISFQEFLADRKVCGQTIQIFGTALNECNISRAQQGVYTKNIEAYVCEKYLSKYFIKTEGGYQVIKFIQDLCLFAKQDITKTSQFSGLDLVCCRNVLIYFDSALQEQVLSILHGALKPCGFLVLGESESVGKLSAVFETLGSKGVVYIKKSAEKGGLMF
jgi:two-component system, chemotaxis family, CheB/CheR fusion protein